MVLYGFALQIINLHLRIEFLAMSSVKLLNIFTDEGIAYMVVYQNKAIVTEGESGNSVTLN